MDDKILYALIALLVGGIVATIITVLVNNARNKKSINSAEAERAKLIKDGEAQADVLKKNKILEAKEEIL